LRTNQAFIVGLTILAFLLGVEAGQWVILTTALVMALGTVHSGFALFMQVHRRILKPAGILPANVHVEDPMPHQFAQAVGATFLLASFAALVSGAVTAGWVLSWIVTALAFINLTVQFCLGCFMYLQLDRRGLLPASIASTRGAHHV
jgi:heme/copper-type cytochrome/quinol oxidase subunit 4